VPDLPGPVLFLGGCGEPDRTYLCGACPKTIGRTQCVACEKAGRVLDTAAEVAKAEAWHAKHFSKPGYRPSSSGGAAAADADADDTFKDIAARYPLEGETSTFKQYFRLVMIPISPGSPSRAKNQALFR